MTPEQQQRQIDSMQTDVTAIKRDVGELSAKIDRMFIALMGSEITQDGGLVQRIRILEDRNKELTKELEDVKKRSSKLEWHNKVIWGVGGFAAFAVLSQIVTIVFKIIHK